MLSINNIEVVYDNIILVLKGVSLEVKSGSITTLLGDPRMRASWHRLVTSVRRSTVPRCV